VEALRRLADWLIVALDWLVSRLPLPEGLDFALSEAALKARKRLAKNRR
jgi:hypothetical protein